MLCNKQRAGDWWHASPWHSYERMYICTLRGSVLVKWSSNHGITSYCLPCPSCKSIAMHATHWKTPVLPASSASLLLCTPHGSVSLLASSLGWQMASISRPYGRGNIKVFIYQSSHQTCSNSDWSKRTLPSLYVRLTTWWWFTWESRLTTQDFETMAARPLACPNCISHLHHHFKQNQHSMLTYNVVIANGLHTPQSRTGFIFEWMFIIRLLKWVRDSRASICLQKGSTNRILLHRIYH